MSLAVIAAGCFWVYYLPYSEVKKRSIESMNTQQYLLATQTARGLEKFFEHYSRVLSYFSNLPSIVSFDAGGERILEGIYRNNINEINAITRIDSTGRIIYTVPFVEEAIGRDVSYQEHNRRVMKLHKPIASDVFAAVQGYRTVAYAYPVFDKDRYTGCLSILVPFQRLAREYLENVRIGEGGYAWMISREGIQLYSPLEGHTGLSVKESFSSYPEVLSMVKNMLESGEGKAVCHYRRGEEGGGELIRYQSVYVPVHLPDNEWYIVVAVPESQILADVEGFRKKWIIITGLLVSLGLVISYYLIKAWAIVREENRRKLAEKELIKSENRFRQLADSTWEAIIILDNGEIVHANDQFYGMFGYSQHELAGRQVLPLIVSKLYSYIQEELMAGDKEGTYEISGIRRDGTEFPIEVRTREMEFHDHKAKVITIRDISDRTKAEEERINLHTRLRQKQKMEALGTLAGGIAHDFNNILTGIFGYVELALIDISDGNEVRKNLLMIKEAGQHAKDMVKQILAFSRRSKPDLKVVQLSTVVENACKLIRPTVPPRIEVRRRIDPVPDLVKADSTQIHQVLLNLCANAVFAMKEKGVLEISLHRERLEDRDRQIIPDLVPDIAPGEYLVITVTDSGEGMDEELVERIFEPFFTTKEPGEGIGMGLSVVHGIIKEHQGAITVSSRQGEGTRFSIYLPAIAEDQPEEEPAMSFSEFENQRILFVDDEQSIVDVGIRMLEKLGFRVVGSTNSKEALEMFTRDPGRFDLVITDQVMLGLTGLELVEKIFEIRKDIPVILCSGYSTLISSEKARRLGIDKFLMKPYSKMDLARAIHNVLEGSRREG